MSLVVNNNMMAANTARNLNAHYGRLATSTQRLSTGLRINNAADDAAGLAIRELQRADISALHQGARNANDAISMIQVADGALGIIDEKLIRMKELAEQAATGTYDSTQRLMIESEYQAMASEITRIANATDFNGIYLLNGTLDGEHDGSGMTASGKMKIHFGTGNDSAEDYYYITIGDCTAQAFGLGNASTWQDVQSRAAKEFEIALNKAIAESDLASDVKAQLGSQVKAAKDSFNSALIEATKPENAYKYWAEPDGDNDSGFLEAGKAWDSASDIFDKFMVAAANSAEIQKAVDKALVDNALLIEKGDPNMVAAIIEASDKAGEEAVKALLLKDPTADADTIRAVKTEAEQAKFAELTKASQASMEAKVIATATADAKAAMGGDVLTLEEFLPSLRPTQMQKLEYAWGHAALYNLSNADQMLGNADQYGIGATFTFGQGIDGGDELLQSALKAAYAKVENMDFAGFTVETQEDAQQALVAINSAIVEKDKIRAHLGATQNRLENTVSNLNIQAENLQAAESRISDVDVGTEMTQFVRNQILTQSAVAMLSQANSLPQMAMQLIGG